MNEKQKVLLTLCASYVVFAILLNSVGTVILQSIASFNLGKTEASVLEGLKDLPIAIVGFFVASTLPRFGFKNALIVGNSVPLIACLMVLWSPNFATIQILFFLVGCSFGIVKIAVYSSIGLIAQDKKEHASLMNFIDGMFMIGVLAGYWIFSAYIDSKNPESLVWTDVYWFISVLSLIAIISAVVMRNLKPITSDKTHSVIQDFWEMVTLVKLPLVIIFVISAFLYVLIEQGIGSWLPTFNNEVFSLPPHMSVQFASIYAVALALGRFSVSAILRKVDWFPVLIGCLICTFALIISVNSLTHSIVMPVNLTWSNAPLAVYLLPLIGLFMAPIYPALNSVILCSLPLEKHSSMAGLIVIFSALGGTTGSILVGYIFEESGGRSAFLLLLIPIAMMIVTLYFFKRRFIHTAL